MNKILSIVMIFLISLVFIISGCSKNISTKSPTQPTPQIHQAVETSIENSVDYDQKQTKIMERFEHLKYTQDFVFTAYTLLVCKKLKSEKTDTAYNDICKPTMDYLSDNHRDILKKLPEDPKELESILWDFIDSNNPKDPNFKGVLIDGDIHSFDDNPYDLWNLLHSKQYRIGKEFSHKYATDKSAKENLEKLSFSIHMIMSQHMRMDM